MKKFTPIAMRCNQEQFDKIKPKLEKAGIKPCHMSSFEICLYLTNNLSGALGSISNLPKHDRHNNFRKVHETWNEKMFLEACGIEAEPEFVITESQIKEIYEFCKMYDKESAKKVREEWFPEAFKKEKEELQVGKWYFYNKFGVSIFYVTKIDGLQVFGYGQSYKGSWKDEKEWFRTNGIEFIPELLREATKQEVFEALKAEAVKRGFVDGVWVDNAGINDFMSKKSKICGVFYWIPKSNILEDTNGDVHIFDNGKWAEIIQTITIEEAEKLLNKKIV